MIQSVKSFLLSAIVSTSPQWSETPKAPTAPTEIKTELMTFQPEKQKIYERLSLKQVLKDPNNRISNEFDIPRNIYWRVTFWYEIYTRYNSKVKLVHHKKYPWIVYHKIDTNPIFEKKGRYYNKVYKAKKFERHERWKIQKALTKLSKRKNYRKLTRL